MTAARWGEIKSVLASVLETDPENRPTALDCLCRGDAELRREVESLLAFEADADEVLHTAMVPGIALRTAAKAPETIGPYKLLRELGQGGMGVVYLGQRADGEYSKQVAIKLITAGRHDGAMQRRFKRERQILAQLEHVGIARLLDGGATAEGQPYFVMEYVEGLPLQEYCNGNKLSVTDRLRLFLRVCEAVSYAHLQLIVHRDLKPGNILVTAEGVPKLLDFGLGRALDAESSDEAVTLTGMPMLTPAYASPEQVRGEPYAVSTDVYSLGVIFYELLAGKRPYRVPAGSYLEIARAIAEQEPVPLSAAADPGPLRRQLAGDLERIAAKVLEKDATRRYHDVRELAADLRRYLEGRPVLARPATLWYRTTKLLRRHRVGVPAAALAVALIIVFAGAAWWQARRAERRFEQVRSLAHSVMFELDDAIAKLPGSTAAQELLVRRALEYLASLAREAGGNAELQQEVALGYERVAIVQGYLAESNLGHVVAALGNFRKSHEILEELQKRDSANAAVRHDYLRVTNELTSAYGSAGQFGKASATARKGVEAAETDFRKDPDGLRSMAELAAAYGTLADTLTDVQAYDRAISLRQKVEELARKVAEGKPNDLESMRSLAVAQKRLGALYGVTQRFAECRREYEAARAIDERRCALLPRDTRAKLDLSYDYSDLGWVTARAGAFADALVSHRKALALRQEVAAIDPNDMRAAVSVASSVDRIGQVLYRMGDLKASLSELQRAVQLYDVAVARSRTDWQTLRNLAEAHVDVAETSTALALKEGSAQAWRARAAAEYQKAIALYEELRVKGMLPASSLPRIPELSAEQEKLRRGER